MRMLAPYTRVVCDVADEFAEAYAERGYVPLEAAREPEPEPEPAPEPVGERPDKDSTIPEIVAYAKANGITLPAKGRKAELLAALG